MTRQTITVASGNFWYWYNSLPLKQKLVLQLYRNISGPSGLDGIEFSMKFTDVYQWAADLCRGKAVLPGHLSYCSEARAKKILELGNHSLHIQNLKELSPGVESCLAGSLATIYHFTGINDFTTHPDEVSLDRFDEIVGAMPEGIRLSIENMDCRKENYQTLEEFEILLDRYDNISMTFDINHWIELGHSQDDPKLQNFLEKYSHRIAKVHYSATSSNLEIFNEHPEIDTPHYPVFGSGDIIDPSFAHQLPEGITWIMEGVIPPDGFHIVQLETASMRDGFEQLRPTAIAV